MLSVLLALPLLLCAAPAEVIVPDGDSHSGHSIITPLPLNMRLENKSGMGLGLCVFTSINNAALWQDVKQLQGFRDWMTKRKGGGWPEKVDSMIADYCKEQGVSTPSYIQHTGGDVAFLEKALRTGRMPGVTYDGRDGVHYRGPIAHMVNLVYLDATDAAILDNNYPREILWMSRDEFVSRWRGQGGGWAVVLADPPPPPRVKRQFMAEQCSGGSCPLPTILPAAVTTPYTWTPEGRYNYLYSGHRFVGTLHPDGSYYEWRGDTPVKTNPPIPLPISNAGEEHWKTHGVDPALLPSGDAYVCNGRKCTRREAHAALGGDLTDDSHKGYIAVIGDPSYVSAVLSAMESPVLSRWKGSCHVRGYAPTAWQVADLSVSKGIVYMGPRGVDGTAAVLGRVDDFTTPERLAKALSAFDGTDKTPSPSPDKPLREDSPIWPYVVGIGAVLLISNSKRSK